MKAYPFSFCFTSFCWLIEINKKQLLNSLFRVKKVVLQGKHAKLIDIFSSLFQNCHGCRPFYNVILLIYSYVIACSSEKKRITPIVRCLRGEERGVQEAAYPFGVMHTSSRVLWRPQALFSTSSTLAELSTKSDSTSSIPSRMYSWRSSMKL